VADRYVYQVAVEAFFQRAMQGRLEGEVRERLREAGLSLDEPLQSVYPSDVFHRCVVIASQAAFPDLPAEEACFRAGRLHIDSFVESYPGKMMSALARQISPQMIVDYTATFIRLGNNFTESRTRVLGPTESELLLNDVGGVPMWYAGVLQRGYEVANIREVEVRLGSCEPPPEARFRISWLPR
jgi:uncharacterized protein (TIGR02265 family)